MKKIIIMIILSMFLTFGGAFADSNYEWTVSVKDGQVVTVYEDCNILEENRESITFETRDRKVYKFYFRNYKISLQRDKK